MSTATKEVTIPDKIYKALSEGAGDFRLNELIDKSELAGTSVEDVRALFDIQKAIEDQDIPQEHEEVKHETGSHGHRGHHDGHTEPPFKPKINIDEHLNNDGKFQEIHQGLQKEKESIWNDPKQKHRMRIIRKWEKEHKQNIDTKAGNEYLQNHEDNPNSPAVRNRAIEKYKETSEGKKRIKDYEAIESKKTFDNRFKDPIGIQYQKHAAEQAREETKNLTQKLRQKKISPEKYRKKANEIYQRQQINSLKQFANEFPEKAAHYAHTDPLLQDALSEIKRGKANKLYKQQQKTMPKGTMVSAIYQGEHLKPVTAPPSRAIQKTNTIPSILTPYRKGQLKNSPAIIKRTPLSSKKKEAQQQSSSYHRGLTSPSTQRGTTVESSAQIPQHHLNDERYIQHRANVQMDHQEKAGPQGRIHPEEISREAYRRFLNQLAQAQQVPARQYTPPPTPPQRAQGGGPTLPNPAKIAQSIKNIASIVEKVGKFISFIASTWEIWLVVFIILLIIILIVILITIFSGGQSQNQNPTTVPGLTIIVKAPPTVANNANLTYEVDVTCEKLCQTQGPILVYVPTLPQGTGFVSADGGATTSPYPITWHLATNTPTKDVRGANNYIFHFTINNNTNPPITPVPQGSTIVYGTVENTGSSPKNIPASNNPCSQYANNPQNSYLFTKYQYDFQVNTVPGFGPKNFGDPNCDFTQTGLAALIGQLDPANKYRWYNVIAKCESHYDPNVEQLFDPFDPAHAWGLFQMGRGKNGPLDHGDVYWKMQTSNAINYNKIINGSFLYWASRNYNPATCHN